MVSNITEILFYLIIIASLASIIFKIYTIIPNGKVSFIVSIIVLLLVMPRLFNNVDEIIYPTPFLKLDSKKVKIQGTNTKGTLNGKASPNSRIILKYSDDAKFAGGANKDIIVRSDNNGNFKATGLNGLTDYKVTAIKYGKKSKTTEISVGNIPVLAYTRFLITNSNEMGDLTLDANEDNKATISGTASPKAIIRITNSDMTESLVKVLHVKPNGEWSTTLDGPHTDEKEKQYFFSAKVNGKLAKDESAVYIKNPSHK